jgi:hypothetical protein
VELLECIPGLVINWEPLHKTKGVIPEDANLKWIPESPNPSDHLFYMRLVTDIVCFSRFSRWTTRYVRLKKLIYSKIVLTKFVRANLLLPWIISNFEFKRKPVYLIRHPVATCLSQQKAFQFDNNILNDQTCKVLGHLFPSISVEDLDLEERIVTWCLNNVSTMSKINTIDKIIIVYYEDLVINPQKEITRILMSLGFYDDIHLRVKKLDFRKSSKTDFNHDLQNEPEAQLNKSLERLNKVSKKRINKIFSYFNFKLYHLDSPLPIKEKLANR